MMIVSVTQCPCYQVPVTIHTCQRMYVWVMSGDYLCHTHVYSREILCNIQFGEALSKLLYNIPPSETIYYLKRYLGGSEKEATEGYFLLTTDASFNEAKALSEERHGDQFLIAA